jgi:hypothetical protein
MIFQGVLRDDISGGFENGTFGTILGNFELAIWELK